MALQNKEKQYLGITACQDILLPLLVNKLNSHNGLPLRKHDQKYILFLYIPKRGDMPMFCNVLEDQAKGITAPNVGEVWQALKETENTQLL